MTEPNELFVEDLEVPRHHKILIYLHLLVRSGLVLEAHAELPNAAASTTIRCRCRVLIGLLVC